VQLLAGNAADAEKSFSTAIALNPKLPAFIAIWINTFARNDVPGALQAYEAGLNSSLITTCWYIPIAALDERQDSLIELLAVIKIC